jgi:2,3-bisphosphoglycerate-independent phosphoglycerate mutase
MKPIVLTILDGWGHGAPSTTNAIRNAQTPNIKNLEEKYPWCLLQPSGITVGLPWKEAGNSEVGHVIIGSGRIIYQYLSIISSEITNGKFSQNPAFLKAITHVKNNNSALHLMGLISSGNVHSYLEHIYALMNLARENNIEKLFFHLFTDGRDAPPKEGEKIVAQLIERIPNAQWRVATIIGREFAMDRNKEWKKTEITYKLITEGVGVAIQDPIAKLREHYHQGITDDFIPPMVIIDENQRPIGLVKDNDAVIFFNFREDSARQITKAFIEPGFNEFPRKKINNLLFCAMTRYDKDIPMEVAYTLPAIKNHLTEVLSQHQRKVLKIAETEKYGHVTYFFNGCEENPYLYEIQKLIPSQNIDHYEQKPEMQAEKISAEIINGVKEKFDLIVANFANADIMGHTGNFEAAVRGVGWVDKMLKPIIDLAETGKCILIITADHGNAEQMMGLFSGGIKTEHTANPVPFYLVGEEFKPNTNIDHRNPQGMLSDIAPTILDLMQIPKPPEMTGESLLGILR